MHAKITNNAWYTSNILTGLLELKQVDGIDKILSVKWAIILWLSTSEKANVKNTLRELFTGITPFVKEIQKDIISNLFSEFELEILNDTFKLTAHGMGLDKCLKFKQSSEAKNHGESQQTQDSPEPKSS